MALLRLLFLLGLAAPAEAARIPAATDELARLDATATIIEKASLAQLNATGAFLPVLEMASQGVQAAAFQLLSPHDLLGTGIRRLEQSPWQTFFEQKSRSDGRHDWDKIKKQSGISVESLQQVVNDPKVAREMVEALMGMLLTRTAIQAQCESTWLGYVAHCVGSCMSSKTHTLIDHSISVVKTEVVTAIAESVAAVTRAADLVLAVLLGDVCRWLALSSDPPKNEEADACREESGEDLLKLVASLEEFESNESPPPAYLPVPSRDEMKARVSKSPETRQLALRIAEYAAALLSVNVGAEAAQSRALTGDLAAVRDKVWACGQPTGAKAACSPPYVTVEVEPSAGGAAEQRYAVKVLGSRYATGLLLYWSSGEAYPADDERWTISPLRLYSSTTQNPNRHGYPGGLGAVAGETDPVKLQERLLYWDPSIGITQWKEELCAHSKLRRGAHDCKELWNMLLDLQSAAWLATTLQGTISLVASGSAGLGSAVATTLSTGGMAMNGGPVYAAMQYGLAAAGVPGAAPIVVVALAAGTVIGGAVWLVYRGSSSGAAALSSEDCLCSLLSTVSRPHFVDGSVELTPKPSDVGLGYSLCTSGLGACPTHSIMTARQETDTLFVSLRNLLAREDCATVEACATAAGEAWGKLNEKLAATKALCAENKECSGEFTSPEHGDGRPVFSSLCKEFEHEKAGTMLQEVEAKLKAAELGHVLARK